MQNRKNARQEWLKNEVGLQNFSCSPLSGDASFRCYFRVLHDNTSYILMDAPPEKEPLDAFIHIAAAFAEDKIYTPGMLAVDKAQGFLLLEDFGDQLLLPILQHKNPEPFYQMAMGELLKIQRCQSLQSTLPAFDIAHMQQELSLFKMWFLETYLKIGVTTEESTMLDQCFEYLTNAIMEQPTVVIHRDYHSRNLMVLHDESPIGLGVIDFQDAMLGPITYDLVSLLKDCYIQWPREQIMTWIKAFYQQLSNQAGVSFDTFVRWFDFCGLQRHLKVLGIFCRLNFRDHKPQYLNDLPLVMNYVLACLETYPEFSAFYRFMQNSVMPTFTEKQA